MESLDAWLLLNASGLTPLRQRLLLQAFGEAAAVMEAGDADLLAVEGITTAHTRRIRRAQTEVDLAAERQLLSDSGISLLPLTAPQYPRLLLETPDPPPLLFVHGELAKRDELAVAIVGTRQCTPYGALVARRLAHDLAARGFTIVSGLAVGVDGEAHEGALEAGGRTLAVMASGPDITYPACHQDLRRRLASQGAALTEYAPGTEPLRERFPARNRIIAGLCLGTVVVEAPLQSGALITADLAAEYGREVMAVPGSVDSPLSHGCHRLIKNGARLVEVAEDVIEGLGVLLDAVPRERPPRDVQVSGDEQRVLEALSFQPRHVDELVVATALATSLVTSALMMLEMKGLVRRFPGNSYVRL